MVDSSEKKILVHPKLFRRLGRRGKPLGIGDVRDASHSAMAKLSGVVGTKAMGGVLVEG
jgi:hypothetical protein